MDINLNSISAESLGSHSFKQDYKIKYAYLVGSMYKGIGSATIAISMARAGLMAYFGTGGLSLDRIEQAILDIKSNIDREQVFGMNLLSDLENSENEMNTVRLFLKHKIRHIEASAYMQITVALVLFRLSGVGRDQSGNIVTKNRILAKVSRPETAELFMRPPPERIVQQLLSEKEITPEQAEIGRYIPLAQDICIEADSGGHTDQGNTSVLLPAALDQREQIQLKEKYQQQIRIGSAGGIGTPEAAASAFLLGADFILTGSINQCSVEAATSDSVKNILQNIGVQDTAYAPAGDMFELGAKIQVVRKGLFFPARANKLYDLYQRYNTIEDIDNKTRTQIETKYFQKTIDEVWNETEHHYRKTNPKRLISAEKNPKQKMALIFRWYFVHTARLALQGNEEQLVNYQIHCGPALGAFNQWIKNSNLEDWHNRHVHEIAELLMNATAKLISKRISYFISNNSSKTNKAPSLVQ